MLARLGHSGFVWIQIGGLLALHLLLFLYLAIQGGLKPTRVQVQGLEYVREADVLFYADITHASTKDLLFLSRLSDRIEKHPLIESAQIRRRDFRSLVIQVQERFPVAVFISEKGPVAIDKNGVVLSLGIVDRVPLLSIQDAAESTAQGLNNPRVLDFLDNLAQLPRRREIESIGMEQGRTSIKMRQLSTIFRFSGIDIPGMSLLERMFSVADAIRNEKLQVRFVEIPADNSQAVGFR